MRGGSVIRWGWYSVAVNLFLTSVHGSIALASGSLAVAAELVHNVADLLTAIAVLIGILLATRKTKAFPYGLYKVENLVAAGLARLGSPCARPTWKRLGSR
jgi:divalent metal cation (Fe/Co/Zn/Cd) transporter